MPKYSQGSAVDFYEISHYNNGRPCRAGPFPATILELFPGEVAHLEVHYTSALSVHFHGISYNTRDTADTPYSERFWTDPSCAPLEISFPEAESCTRFDKISTKMYLETGKVCVEWVKRSDIVVKDKAIIHTFDGDFGGDRFEVPSGWRIILLAPGGSK